MTHRTLPAPEILFQHDAHVGEGPVWDPRLGALVWVDIPNGHVFTTDPAGRDDAARPRSCRGRGPATGVGRLRGGPPGRLLRAAGRGRARAHRAVEAENPTTRMNDGEIDPAGRFWAGTMGWGAEPNAGALYRLDPDGTVRQMLDGVTISNGLGWSPDGTIMYYVDTPTMRVDMFDFDAASGDIGHRREFVTIRHGGGRPDGLTVDSDGAVWVATWPGYGVHRYLPDGTLDAVIPLPVSNVSSIELGGPDMRDAWITTAWELLSEEEHAAQPLSGSLFHTRVDVPGVPRVPFAG